VSVVISIIVAFVVGIFVVVATWHECAHTRVDAILPPRLGFSSASSCITIHGFSLSNNPPFSHLASLNYRAKVLGPRP